MRRLDEFRIYYNHTIHPELVRMELDRKKLIRLLLLSLILIIAIVILELYIGVLFITLAGVIPIFIYVSLLFWRIQKFRKTFKPNIVNLLLDFLDDRLNYGEFKYKGEKFLPKTTFLDSEIFTTQADIYRGEDYISGAVGNLEFELCEVSVEDKSPVNGKLRQVFKGIFLHSSLDAQVEGKLLILPKERRQFLERSIKRLTDKGGKNIDNSLHDAPYLELFTTYTQPSKGDRQWHTEGDQTIEARDLLSTEIQRAIADYCTRDQKKTKNKDEESEGKKLIYISFINRKIYIFLSQPKDFLEPYLFKSNVSFGLVREFFEDIELVVRIIEDFDRFY